jgi:hypothetical protein
MTTYIDFSQPVTAPFQFQATLDGNNYNVTVPWSLQGARYYIQVATLNGDVVVYIPRIESPLGYDINLVAGYFTTSTLVWRGVNNQFEINP